MRRNSDRRSFIEKVKEHLSEYKTSREPITIPPINLDETANYLHAGFDHEEWENETLKSCKINAINATVNVSR